MKQFSHENIIQILDIIPPNSTATDFDEVYIVQDLMETDLHRIIYSKQGLSIDHIQYFIYQILRGLKYIHSANVLHRDLKPSNLLLKSNCDLKICDFGLARVDDVNTGDLTEYVVTRWYRAPEIMLACQEYTSAIDVWSVGCIFGELLARQPLFPGDDYIAQLRLICNKLGRPKEEELDFVTSERAKKFMLSLPPNNPIPFGELFPSYKNEKNALNLLKEMLEIHPKKRITIEKALEHPFLASLHNVEDEPVHESSFRFEFENEQLSRERIQELIWKEIREFHPDIPLNYPSSSNRRRASKVLDANLENISDAKETSNCSSASEVDDKDSKSGAKKVASGAK